MSNLVAPEKGLTIALLQSVEGTGGPEGLAYIADRSLDATLLISRAHRAGPGQKVVVTTEFEKSRIKEDGVAAATPSSLIRDFSNSVVTTTFWPGPARCAREIKRVASSERSAMYASPSGPPVPSTLCKSAMVRPFSGATKLLISVLGREMIPEPLHKRSKKNSPVCFLYRNIPFPPIWFVRCKARRPSTSALI